MGHRIYLFLMKRQVILALFLVTLAWFVFQTRAILMSIFISYIIMAALHPAVIYFKKRGLPHLLSVIIPYVATLIIAVVIVFPLIPFIVQQVQSLISNLPVYADQAAKSFGFGIDADAIEGAVSSEVANIGKNAVTVTGRVFGGIFSVVTILIVAFYLLLYHDEFKEFIVDIFHRNVRDRVRNTLTQIDDKLGAWLRGQIALSVFIWLLTWIVLSILGVPFALPLAILAGILEIIPTLGPTIAAIPAFIVALTISPTLGVFVLIAYIIIQLIENNILVPKIMQKAVGLNPVIVILGVMIGANLMGVLGALLSIPFIALLIVLFSSLKKNFDLNNGSNGK